MCSSKSTEVVSASTDISSSSSSGSGSPAAPRINGRPVLQPTSNVVPGSWESHPIKKPLPPLPPQHTKPASEEVCPQQAVVSDRLNSTLEKVPSFRSTAGSVNSSERKSFSLRSKSFNGRVGIDGRSSMESYSSSLIVESPGSIAAVRREQVALQQAQRKMRIAHYGRSKSAKFESRIVPLLDAATTPATIEEKRCAFITANSDPLYVAYHDEEWGFPVHDDKMLFELLILSGAQVGSDWTSILKKRQSFSKAFSGYDPEIVASLTDKQIVSIGNEHGIDVSRVRGVVDNSKRILEIRKDFGSFDKYIWGFVNYKPLCPQYKFGHKIPVKTSKSESISKDMVRRGFRSVGPTVVHSFMQAAGLTNDHLITCHRHQQLTRPNN